MCSYDTGLLQYCLSQFVIYNVMSNVLLIRILSMTTRLFRLLNCCRSSSLKTQHSLTIEDFVPGLFQSLYFSRAKTIPDYTFTPMCDLSHPLAQTPYRRD